MPEAFGAPRLFLGRGFPSENRPRLCVGLDTLLLSLSFGVPSAQTLPTICQRPLALRDCSRRGVFNFGFCTVFVSGVCHAVPWSANPPSPLASRTRSLVKPGASTWKASSSASGGRPSPPRVLSRSRLAYRDPRHAEQDFWEPVPFLTPGPKGKALLVHSKDDGSWGFISLALVFFILK